MLKNALLHNLFTQEDEDCEFEDIEQLNPRCLRHFWDRQNRYRFLQFSFEVSLF
jgi:hypothetical protein